MCAGVPGDDAAVECGPCRPVPAALTMSASQQESSGERHRPAGGEAGERPGPIRLPEALPLLQAIGLATAAGEIRADKRRKFNQVNRFVELVAPLVEAGPKRRMTFLDCGCGKSYLSFVLNYFVREKLGRRCHFWGLDANPERIRQAEALRDTLGYDNMEFVVGRAVAFRPPEPPDGVLSLHACDTATDEALAKGIELGARFILAVPCCQSELLNQMRQHPLSAITRHGVYAARLADLLTDGLRTLALEAAGYDASIVEYISPEDTPKNLMIRAERQRGRNTVALHRYWDLVEQYQVDPAIQRFLPWLRPRRQKAVGRRQ
jgi:methyltransferase family protein